MPNPDTEEAKRLLLKYLRESIEKGKLFVPGADFFSDHSHLEYKTTASYTTDRVFERTKPEPVAKRPKPPGQCVALYIDEVHAMNMPRNYHDSKEHLEETFGTTGRVTMYRDEEHRRFVYLWSEE